MHLKWVSVQTTQLKQKVKLQDIPPDETLSLQTVLGPENTQMTQEVTSKSPHKDISK